MENETCKSNINCQEPKKPRDPCCKNLYNDFADKFEKEFDVICETLKDELDQTDRMPCINCCVPKYLNRNRSRSRCCHKSREPKRRGDGMGGLY